MTQNVDAAVRSRQMKIPPYPPPPAPLPRLRRGSATHGRPLQERLEEALGPELARRLVLSLAPSYGSRR